MRSITSVKKSMRSITSVKKINEEHHLGKKSMRSIPSVKNQ
jgi:hypothetical protein